MQDLIEIKQLPIIQEELIKVSKEIDEKVNEAMSLVCNDETIKTVKNIRTDLNKRFEEFEEQRKHVKQEIMKLYEEFEKVYKECISNKFNTADKDLKNKIDNVENQLKTIKKNELVNYFDKLKEESGIDFVNFEQIGLNITLSASKKSLLEQINNFVNKVKEDLQLIDLQEHRDEIIVEYKKNLNVSNAVTTVNERIKAIQEEKKKQEEMAIKKADENIQKASEEFRVNLSKFNTEFKITKQVKYIITGDEKEINRINEFLKLNNISFESEEI